MMSKNDAAAAGGAMAFFNTEASCCLRHGLLSGLTEIWVRTWEGKKKAALFMVMLASRTR